MLTRFLFATFVFAASPARAITLAEAYHLFETSHFVFGLPGAAFLPTMLETASRNSPVFARVLDLHRCPDQDACAIVRGERHQLLPRTLGPLPFAVLGSYDVEYGRAYVIDAKLQGREILVLATRIDGMDDPVIEGYRFVDQRPQVSPRAMGPTLRVFQQWLGLILP